MALTLDKVNTALAELGIAERLVKGKDYFYFAEGDAHRWPSTMVCVSRITDMTLAEWVAHWESLYRHFKEQE